MNYLLLALLISTPAHAKLKCEGEAVYNVMDVLAEEGCKPSGLVLLQVETMCVDEGSPALSTLKAGKGMSPG